MPLSSPHSLINDNKGVYNASIISPFVASDICKVFSWKGNFTSIGKYKKYKKYMTRASKVMRAGTVNRELIFCGQRQ